MIKDKKTIYYEINPLFFKDENGDGFGDFKGFLKKIDYFSFLGIDCIIFPDIFNNIKELNLKNYIQIEKKYGTLEELQLIIQKLNQYNISFAYEINLKNIQDSWLLSLNKNSPKENSKKDFYLDHNFENNHHKNWDEKENLQALKHLLDQLNKLGINNYIITNFEYLFNANEIISAQSINQIKQIYNIIKLNENIEKVGLKSELISSEIERQLLEDKICDFFINTSLNSYGISPKYGINKLEKFKIKKLFKHYQNHFENIKNFENRNVLAFSTNKSGRINSRWGKEGVMYQNSAKAIGTFLLTSPSSSLIYYGDEIGMINLDIDNYEDFNDVYIYERKREYQSNGFKEKDFFKANKTLSPINNNNYFQWNNNKNLGFTNDESLKNLQWKLTKKNKDINVFSQFEDENSVLSYYKKLINFIKKTEYVFFFNNYDYYKIQLVKKSIIRIKYFKDKSFLTININMSDKWIRIKKNKNSKIILQSNNNKLFISKKMFLEPYEVILEISKNFDN
ncbi:MAG: alpha-amylase family glycosyl hydrolase [Metamycoplasmataceae bacterium]